MTEPYPGQGINVLGLGRVGLGTANLGNLNCDLSDEQCAELLEAAWAAGIRYFDTAPHYGLGLSERRLGAFLRTRPRNEYFLSTKVGRLLRERPGTSRVYADDPGAKRPVERVWDFSETGIRQSLEESLARLGLDRVDLVYLHDPEAHNLGQGMREALTAMATLKAENSVAAIGVGSMNTEALRVSAESGLINYLMLAGRYTLAEQPAFPAVFEACARNNVGIVNASVFNSGLLSTSAPAKNPRYNYGAAPEALLRHVNRIRDVCAKFEVELPTAALHFTARNPQVVSVVVAGNHGSQVTQNVAALNRSVPEPLWVELVAQGLIPEPPA